MNNLHVGRNILEYSDNKVTVIPCKYPKGNKLTALIEALGFTEENILPSPKVGNTGYLEVSKVETEGHGTDEHGRKFVQFKVEKKTEFKDWAPSFIRIFQRYLRSEVLVSCELGRDFCPSAVTEHELGALIEAITKGTEVVNNTLEGVYWFEVEYENISAEEAHQKDSSKWDGSVIYLRR